MSDDSTKRPPLSIEQRQALMNAWDSIVGQPEKRDPKLLALLDAARALSDVVGAGPAFRDQAINALEAAALVWAAVACPICGRRGDHEWEELTGGERVAHEAEATSQGM